MARLPLAALVLAGLFSSGLTIYGFWRTYTITIVYVVAVVVTVLYIFFLGPTNVRKFLTKAWVMAFTIFALVLLLAIIGSIEYPRTADFGLEAVCDSVSLDWPEKTDVELSSPQISQVWLSVTGTQIECSSVSISDSSAAGAFDSEYQGKLVVTPLTWDQKAIPPVFVLEPRAQGSIRTKLLFPDKIGSDSQRLSVKWDQSQAATNPQLLIDPASLVGFTMQLSSFTMEVQQCTVKCGKLNDTVTQEPKRFHCTVLNTAAPVSWKFGTNRSSHQVFDVHYAPGERTDVTYASIVTTFIHRILCQEIHSGMLAISKQDPIDFWKDFVSGPGVAIKGKSRVTKLALMPDGFHVRLKGASDQIDVDGEPKISNFFYIWIKLPTFLAIIGFLAWLVDRGVTWFKT